MEAGSGQNTGSHLKSNKLVVSSILSVALWLVSRWPDKWADYIATEFDFQLQFVTQITQEKQNGPK